MVTPNQISTFFSSGKGPILQKMYWFGGLGEVEVEIWLDVTIAGRTNERTKRKDRATQPLDHGRLR